MDNLMENLNKEQLEAVTHREGPLLIVAGAGTGKTTVITQRIAYLIEQGRAKAEEILALTFTEKAAGEMEERVDRLLPIGYTDLWISTFHSFGERLLMAHGLEIGLPGATKPLNEFGQYALLKNNLEKLKLDYYRPLGNPTKFIQALLKHFSRLKDENITPVRYLEYAEELKQNVDQMLSGNKAKSSKFQAPNPKQIPNSKFQIPNMTNAEGKINKEIALNEIKRINEVANAYHVYQQLLLDNDFLDFGDLINYTLKLFRERPQILEYYRRQFKYILLDEFQDTNWAQYELIKLLAAPKNNLVVVGDDDQSIYKFRGASVANILQFKKDFSRAKEIVLVKNYRSQQNILDLAYGFIQLNNPNRLEYQLNNKNSKSKKHPSGRLAGKMKYFSKKLIAQNQGKGDIDVIEGADISGETRLILEKIADLKIRSRHASKGKAPAGVSRGEASWSDFGILVRANESAKQICSYLLAAGLPYQYLASRGLYTKPLIMDVVAYLKLLDNYHESAAVYRILKLSVFEFSDQELINFNYWAKKKAWSLYETLKSARSFNIGEEVTKKIDLVLGLIARHSSLARDKSVSEVVVAFLNDSGLLKDILVHDNSSSREEISYLNQFMKRIKEFEASSDDLGVKAFLSELNTEIEAGEEGSLVPDFDAGPDTIKVMTVHSAKGLEFRYVFIAGLVDKRFPTTRRRELIEVPDALVKEILLEGDIHLEEERRLFYVAITRAKESLYFSWAPDYGGVRKKKPSLFLEESGLLKNKTEILKSSPEANSKFQISKQIQPANHREAQAGRNPTSGLSPVSLPSYFSYTQLAAFNNCPYQYRFAHILKVPTRSKYTFSFGQTMHLALQRIYQLAMEKKGFGQDSLFARGARQSVKPEKALVSPEEMIRIYQESWIDNWYESKTQKDEYRKLGEASLRGYYQKFHDNWPRVISLEQGINLKLKGYRIFGKIDRIDDLGDEGLRIVDYKTGTPKNRDKIEAEDRDQLLIYQLAAEQSLGKKIASLQFYYLNDNSEINFVGSQKDLSDMGEKVVGQIEKIVEAAGSGAFPPKPGVLCRYCDFLNICEFRKV